MSNTTISTQAPANAIAAKQHLSTSFFRKGIMIAIASGMCYGLYSAFVTVAMSKGIWAEWYSPTQVALNAVTVIYVLGALGSGINDTCSAIWTWIIAGTKGKLGDFFKCLGTRAGKMMIIAALIGGPIASAAYIISLQLAGSIIIPITALCPAIGAILGRIFFKQKLNARMMVGILVCIGASIMIGSTAMGADAAPELLLGCIIAFIAALGWGIEGCVCGYATTMIDYEIGITIRQTTSGLTNLIIIVPIMSMIAGDIALAPKLIGQAFGSPQAMIFFAVSGFFAVFAYSLWYKGNSMCGTALGMACNGAYSFWGPFFCWLVIGVVFGQDGWAIAPIGWAAAIVMVIGIFLIAVNPLDFFKKKEKVEEIKVMPIYYAILKYFTTVDEASAEDVMHALKGQYSDYRTFTRKSVIEALMTAESNAILEETRYELDSEGVLKVYYRASEDGLDTINKYIKG